MNSPSLSPQSVNFWLEKGGADQRMRWRQGGCHCGAVRIAVLAPDEIEAVECNCSICRKTGFLHLIVPKERFRLLTGEDRLVTYSFNTGTAKHLFCAICGVKSFYVPRSHPDGFSVNVRCLDEGAVKVAKVAKFDGGALGRGEGAPGGYRGAPVTKFRLTDPWKNCRRNFVASNGGSNAASRPNILWITPCPSAGRRKAVRNIFPHPPLSEMMGESVPGLRRRSPHLVPG